MKRSLRDFLLTLLISVVIFAVVAFFLIRAAEGLMGDVVGNVRSAKSDGKEVAVINETADAAQTGEEPAAVPQNRVFSMFFAVLDDEKKADAIFFVGVNAEKKCASVVLIPANTGVTEVGVTYRLGEMYAARGMAAVERVLGEQIGMTPTYYMALTRDGLSNWVDFIGGVPFNVPQNMDGFDSAGNRRIHLQAGQQKLNGDQVAQFLAFRDYGGSVTARDDALLSFARSFCTFFLQSPNFSVAKNIFYNVAHHADTNMEEKDLTRVGGVLFSFNEHTPNYVRIPGATDAAGYYSISDSRAKPLFELYQ